MGPLHAALGTSGRATYLPVTDDEALAAAFQLARLEGIIPALETAHALAVFEKEKFGKDDMVVVCLSGRGDKDMETYINAFENEQD